MIHIQSGIERAAETLKEALNNGAPVKTYRVHAWKFDPEDEGQVVECEDDDPHARGFGLYLREQDGCLSHVEDFDTREAAEAVIPSGAAQENLNT